MPSELISSEKCVQARSPDAWEEAMSPIAGVQVKEVLGRRFSAEMQLFKLPRTSFFSLKLPSARVVVPDGNAFVGVTVVTNGRMQTASPRSGSVWETGTAHVINHDDYSFDFTSDQNMESMAICFQKTMLREYSRKFHGCDDSQLERDIGDVSLSSSVGECFARYSTFLWGELNRGGDFLRSPMATEEIEDSLLALLLSAIKSECRDNGSRRSGGYQTYVRPAEDYILGKLDAPLRVADIAAAVGISVPTLNRAFRKCHGMGPKAFVKQRRLDRVRTELRSTDSQTTTVTDIASKYGFWHLSQFASDYQKRFEELPSQTLRHR